jgi:hypothetical protein
MFVTTAPRQLTTTGLEAIVFTIARDPALWRPSVAFTTGSRYWTRIATPEVFRDSIDIWLLTWLPEQGTQLHDHGDSAAAFRVLEGALQEVRPEGGDLRGTRYDAGRTQRVEVGQLHDVSNPFDQPAISLHAYSPRLTRMTYYDVGPHGPVPVRTVATTEPEEELQR